MTAAAVQEKSCIILYVSHFLLLLFINNLRHLVEMFIF